jgi:hypothetical protein
VNQPNPVCPAVEVTHRDLPVQNAPVYIVHT